VLKLTHKYFASKASGFEQIRHNIHVYGVVGIATSYGRARPGFDFSPSSSPEVKNGGALPPLLYTPSWHRKVKIKLFL
jgi:hypothetical protein